MDNNCNPEDKENQQPENSNSSNDGTEQTDGQSREENKQVVKKEETKSSWPRYQDYFFLLTFIDKFDTCVGLKTKKTTRKFFLLVHVL
jgi:hypothetical protein